MVRELPKVEEIDAPGAISPGPYPTKWPDKVESVQEVESSRRVDQRFFFPGSPLA
jgi:hypothetical protein